MAAQMIGGGPSLLEQVGRVINPFSNVDAAGQSINLPVFVLLAVIFAAATVVSALSRRRYRSMVPALVGQPPGGSVSEIIDRLSGRRDRFAEAVPAVLLTLGLLFTFLGLAIAIKDAADTVRTFQGLSGLDPTAATKKLEAGLETLTASLNVLGFKFRTSVWGLSLSIASRPIVGHLVKVRGEVANEIWLTSTRVELERLHREKANDRAARGSQAQLISAIAGSIASLVESGKEAAVERERMLNAMGQVLGVLQEQRLAAKELVALAGIQARHEENDRGSSKAFRDLLCTQLAGLDTKLEVLPKAASSLESAAAGMQSAGERLASSTAVAGKALSDAAGGLSHAVKTELSLAIGNIAKAVKSGQDGIAGAAKGVSEASNRALTQVGSDLGKSVKTIADAIEKAGKATTAGQVESVRILEGGLGKFSGSVDELRMALDTKLDGLVGESKRLGTVTAGLAGPIMTLNELHQKLGTALAKVGTSTEGMTQAAARLKTSSDQSNGQLAGISILLLAQTGKGADARQVRRLVGVNRVGLNELQRVLGKEVAAIAVDEE